MTRSALARLSCFALFCLCFSAGCQGLGKFGRQDGVSLLSREKSSPTEKQAADLQVALGRSLEAEGHIDQALAAYSQAVGSDPSRADAWARLAVLHDQQGNFSESAKLYRRALQADPGNPDLFADVGYSCYLQGRLVDAESNLRQAIALERGHRRARNNLGLVLARQGRLEDAMTEFRRAGGSPADAHANVAFALVLDRRFDQAREHYQRALDADPESEIARSGLDDLENLLSRIDEFTEEPMASADSGRVVPQSQQVAITNSRNSALPDEWPSDDSDHSGEWYPDEVAWQQVVDGPKRADGADAPTPAPSLGTRPWRLSALTGER